MNLEYECHVTVKDDPERHATWNTLAELHKWKTSYIVGDPLLGHEGFFYFTCHDNDVEAMFAKMRKLCAVLRNPVGGILGRVLREKIELIIYDTKKTLLPQPTKRTKECPMDCIGIAHANGCPGPYLAGHQ